MEEHHLARTGMIDPTAIVKLGKVFSVDGVVAGSFVTLGREAVVNARIINVETGIIAADRRRGCIHVPARQGPWQTFPLISLSIGIVTTEHRILDHYAKVVRIASEMKAYCKTMVQHHLSRFTFDRRREA